MTRYLTHIYDGNTDSDQLRMRTDAGGCRIFGFALVYLEAVAWLILTPISINHPNTHTIYQPFRLGRLLPSFCLASLCSNLSSILQPMATHSVSSIDLHSFVHNLWKCITTTLPMCSYSSVILCQGSRVRVTKSNYFKPTPKPARAPARLDDAPRFYSARAEVFF